MARKSTQPNVRTVGYKRMESELPKPIQELARAAYRLFLNSPSHPSLRHHQLKDTKQGRHHKGSCSVSIGYQYRAIYVPDGATNVWYWIGTHQGYNNFVGLK